MADAAVSVGYLILSASVFGCIFLLLLKWNSEEKIPLEERQEQDALADEIIDKILAEEAAK